MAAFFSNFVVMDGTPMKLVDPVDFDRAVYFSESTVRIGFTSSAMWFRPIDLAGHQIVLPADEELWAIELSGQEVRYLVTSIAR